MKVYELVGYYDFQFHRSISRLIKMANRDVELAEDCDGMKEQSERNYQLPAFSSPLRRGALATASSSLRQGERKEGGIMDTDTYFEHFKEVTNGIKDLANLARKLQMNEVATVLLTLAAVQYMGDFRHVEELAALCRTFGAEKLAWLEKRRATQP